MAAAAWPAGCASDPSGRASTQNAAGTVRITEAELAEQLNEYVDRFTGVITGASNEISRNATDRSVRKAALLWKVRATELIHDTVFGADPQKAFIDTVTLTVRMRKFFEGTDTAGATAFADQQQVAIDAARLLEDDIYRVGGLFLNSDQLESLKRDVGAFTDQHPIRGTFVMAYSHATGTQKSPVAVLDWVTKVPLAPFRAFEGIDAGAQAISEFNITARQFARIVEDMPEQTRWQVELLLYELEERESVVLALDSFRSMSQSAASLAGTAQALPAELREQLSLTWQDFEQRQSALQQTLADTRQALDALNAAVSKATAMADSFNEAGGSVARAGEAWRDAMTVIDEMGQGSEPSPTEQPARPFDIMDYARTAERLTAAAAELRSLVAEARETLESPQLGVFSDTALKDAEQRGRNVTDHAAWRALQLIGVVFVLAIVYRLITARTARRKSNA